MLGTQRSKVTVAALTMQTIGSIKSRRGNITILDRDGIEDLACDCYCAVKDQYDAAQKYPASGITPGKFKVDLMIVNLFNTPAEEMLEFGRDVSRQAKLNILIVVMVANFGADMEGQNVRISESEYIVYLEEAEQLFDLMDDLLSEKIAA